MENLATSGWDPIDINNKSSNLIPIKVESLTKEEVLPIKRKRKTPSPSTSSSLDDDDDDETMKTSEKPPKRQKRLQRKAKTVCEKRLKNVAEKTNTW